MNLERELSATLQLAIGIGVVGVWWGLGMGDRVAGHCADGSGGKGKALHNVAGSTGNKTSRQSHLGLECSKPRPLCYALKKIIPPLSVRIFKYFLQQLRHARQVDLHGSKVDLVTTHASRAKRVHGNQASIRVVRQCGAGLG